MAPQPVFVLGPQRTGTTWLYEQFCAQPSGIYIDRAVKESNLFLENAPPESLRAKLTATATGRGEARLLADVCTSYAGSREVVERIDATFPDALFVWIDRERVSRTRSVRAHQRFNRYGRHVLGYVVSDELHDLQADLAEWASWMHASFPGRTCELKFAELEGGGAEWLERLSVLTGFALERKDISKSNASRDGASRARRLFYGAARYAQASRLYESALRLRLRQSQPDLRTAAEVRS